MILNSVHATSAQKPTWHRSYPHGVAQLNEGRLVGLAIDCVILTHEKGCPHGQWPGHQPVGQAREASAGESHRPLAKCRSREKRTCKNKWRTPSFPHRVVLRFGRYALCVLLGETGRKRTYRDGSGSEMSSQVLRRIGGLLCQRRCRKMIDRRGLCVHLSTP